ncbi:DUF3105 domain-containing protein [Streptomyces cinnabarinus]|uniref:DUF3105 domain-containing protein n=1 Tax=Streptomyces cinnabarinus TaxID=67287 RepID=A0ABY7KED0_9ACTN|nr:DUF3105 domain-containing protein [Streptomyces cinnabarinus]WAZ21306.1 DUF3105 domain-containing protein [Streptomyces cinnabarinus]
MGSAKKSNAERKARIEEMRRAEQARERRNRILTIGASVTVVVALVVGAVVLVQSQDDNDTASDSKTTGSLVAGADGVSTWKGGKLSQTHVEKKVKYPVEPPVGGDHNPVWQNCNGDVYTEAVANENAVHSLEHGAVWVTYTSKAKKADVEALAAKVKQTPYTLMSPYEDQKSPIMLSAWGAQRAVTGADDANLGKFFEKYVQGEQTPEPGAACTGGKAE